MATLATLNSRKSCLILIDMFRLFGYCYKEEVRIGVLTDGPTWKLYYPYGEGDFKDRLFCEMNLMDGDQNAIASGLLQYLAFDTVISGQAIEHSRSTYVDYQWQRLFVSVWDSMLQAPDAELVRTFRKRVNEKGGSRPERQAAIEFLKRQGAEESAGKEAVPSNVRNTPELNGCDNKSTESSAEPASPFFTLRGVTTQCRTGKEVFVGIFRELATRDANFCERYARSQKAGRKRRELAKRVEDLYPAGFSFSSTDANELPGGWWIDTNLSNAQKEDRIQRACEVAGIKFGRDLIVSLTR